MNSLTTLALNFGASWLERLLGHVLLGYGVHPLVVLVDLFLRELDPVHFGHDARGIGRGCVGGGAAGAVAAVCSPLVSGAGAGVSWLLQPARDSRVSAKTAVIFKKLLLGIFSPSFS